MQKNGYSDLKRIALLLCSIFLTSALLAQEQQTFVALQDTVAFSYEWTRDSSIDIQAGDSIVSNATIFYGTRYNFSEERHLLIAFGETNNHYVVFAKYFKPANTEDIFGEDIFIDYPPDYRVGHGVLNIPIGDVDAMWVPDYYADILSAQDRARLLELRPGLVNLIESGHTIIYWYEFPSSDIRNGRAMFFNSAIKLGIGANFAVRNIRRTDFGYIVNCVVSTSDWRRPWEFVAALAGTAFWDAYHPGDAVTLLLFLDGDYLDIYTYGTDIHVGTFIRVGREFIAQYQSLIRTNTSDLTNVVWPARAEGSTGIRPRVALADSALLQAEEVPVAAQVEVAIITTIEAVPVEAAVIAAMEAPPAAAVENAPATSAMPLWAWLAIGGGALAVAGGVVVARGKR
jgi:hypothetical protein